MQKSVLEIAFFFLQMIIVWIIATFLFLFLRTFGLPEHMHNLGLENHLPAHFPFWLNLGVGTIAGILFSITELGFSHSKFRRWSYRNLLLLKMVVYFLFVKLNMLVGILISSKVSDRFLNMDTIHELLTSKIFWVLLVYFFIVISLITFIRQVNQKFGPGILWKMLKGTYYQPKEDQRIFMFLDLKSSTTIAEELGHILFSKLIQDCFYDLNEIVSDYKAEIYQYVGDEAVLSWRNKDGFKNSNCVEVFFAFYNKIQGNSAYYLEKYGIIPEFKAGLHFGKVTVAEVGVVKKEIAYHGDVLNTAARIQSQCNKYEQKLLISKDLLNQLVLRSPFKSIDIGEVQLKGKLQTVILYGIQR